MPSATVPRDEALSLLDVSALRRWALLVRSTLAARRAEIDALNVFPVPDGDTGTNLFLTVDGALDRGRGADPVTSGGDLLAAAASSLLWAARGNSGVILSQLARGLAEASRGQVAIDARTLALGLARADELAWQAVSEPKEGTILSVSRAAAIAAGRAVDGGLHAVAAAAAAAARAALAVTPEQLPVLARAGVVDAGAAGFVVVLECLERVCSGGHEAAGHGVGEVGEVGEVREDGGRRHRRDRFRPRVEPPRPGNTAGRRLVAPPEPGEPRSIAGGPAYEVMFLLADATDASIEQMRGRLVELGDSVLVVGGEGQWNVHAHVDDPGAAVEAGIEAGRPHRVRITSLEDAGHVHRHQASGHGHGDLGEGYADVGVGGVGVAGTNGQRDGDRWPPGPTTRTRCAIVACAVGPGLADLFAAAGAAVVRSGPSGRASTGQLIEAIRAQHRAGANAVVVLPNDGDTELAAGAAVRAVADEGIEAHVVRACTAVQGVAALAVFEPSAGAADNLLAMQSAAAATRHGSVCVASRSALTSAGPCEPGDVLGIVDGDIVVVGSDQVEVARDVVHRLLASGGELLTVVVGAGAPPGIADAVSREERVTHRGLEVVVIDGGQPVHSVLLGVE